MFFVQRISHWYDCIKTKHFYFVTVKFHIAHLYEVQGKVKGAKERYELLLRDKTITQSLKADIFRQLGKS